MANAIVPPLMQGSEDEMGPSLVDLLRRHAARSPEAICLAYEDEAISFQALDERSNKVANALIAQGVKPGDRVALLDLSSPVSYELSYGCAKAGAIMMPLNWRLSAREVAAIVANGRPRVLLYATSMASLLDEVTTPLARINIDQDYAAWRDVASAIDPSLAYAPDDAVLLLYTSGTTGQPKGVMISHRNLSFVGRTASEAWGFTTASVNLVAMPLFHIGGIGYGMMALSQGGKTVLVRQADAKTVMDAMHRHHVTHGFFVPTVIQQLVDRAEECGDVPNSMERMIYGGAAMSPTLLARALAAFGCGFSHAYGMTETSGTVISLPPEDHATDGPHAERLRSCGRAFPWVELAIMDPAQGQPVASGEVGEIWVRSGMNMRGYWENPQATAATITPDGWLRTGDAACQDADGYVYIRDRYKDMIVSGGENIYPTEIENVLHTHQAVKEVAVVGVPHPRWGETPRAYVVLKPGETVTEAALLEYTRARLARYKCPTSFVLLAALPRNASGKVLKHELRALHVEEQHG